MLRLFLSEIISYLFQKFTLTYGHESRLRLIIAILLAITFVFSILDVPSIIASFLIGYVLSSVPNINDIKEKLNTIGHGFFIPIFLFIIGLELDFSFIKEFTSANFFFLILVSSAIIAKICFGTLGSLLIGISAKDSLTLGLLSTTRLTVTASVGYIAFQMGIIDELIYTSLISLTAISSLVMPPLTVFIHRCWR